MCDRYYTPGTSKAEHISVKKQKLSKSAPPIPELADFVLQTLGTSSPPVHHFSVQNHPPLLAPAIISAAHYSTRPPTLPPKAGEEESKHRREHREIMAAAMARKDKDQKEQKKIEQKRILKEQRILELSKVWKGLDIPMEFKKKSKQLRELVFEGIPPFYRGKVWPLAVGNSLNLTPALFEIYKERAIEARQKEEGEAIGREGSLILIPNDLHRTFPWLNIFKKEGPYYNHLRDILEAFVCYRPDIGYVQGMSFVAAVFLLNLEPFEAFLSLSNILNQPFFLTVYRMEEGEINTLLNVLESLLEEHVPSVHNHFRHLGIRLDIFSVDWFLTIFASSLPLDLTSRIWDNFFLDCDAKYLFRVALALISMLSKELVEMEFEGCVNLLGKIPQDIDAEKLFNIINGINITSKRWESLVQFEMKTVSLSSTSILSQT